MPAGKEGSKEGGGGLAPLGPGAAEELKSTAERVAAYR